MEKVILITGASSGIGNETAKLFQSKNWKVAATMRDPGKAEDLQKIVDIECLRLDVTDPDSIRTAIARAIEIFGRIDVVVNNAGYALFGPFEASSSEQIERQYETNVLGVMNVCREILPYFREQKKGTIVNLASVGGRMTFPFYSVYNSTKWAVEGFTEALQYELAQFNIRVKLIEPGPIKTDFYNRSEDTARKEGLTAYDFVLDKASENMHRGRCRSTGWKRGRGGNLRSRHGRLKTAALRREYAGNTGREAIFAGYCFLCLDTESHYEIAIFTKR